jgi:sulfonate transport system permease protein
VAETIASDNGMGFMTMNARDFFQTAVVLVAIYIYALLGKAAER